MTHPDSILFTDTEADIMHSAPTTGSATPWGTADYHHVYADGNIVFVGTPSHGGFWISPEYRDRMPAEYRAFGAKWSKGWGDQWYEEDCAALCVTVTFADDLNIDMTEQFEAMLDRYIKGA